MDDIANASPLCKGQPVDSVVKSASPAEASVNLDIEMLKVMRGRLTVEELGRLSVQIARAASAKRPSELQRLLLTIMTHREGTA